MLRNKGKNSLVGSVLITVFSVLLIFGSAVNQIKTDRAEAVDSKTKRFALLIGISKYKGGKPSDIDGCVNNVDLLRKTLPDWGFDDAAASIKVLKNEQATAKGIVDAFRSHLIANAAREKAAGREAQTFYYFCGHGSQYPNTPNDDEENDGMDETFLAWDSRASGQFDILDDQIADLRYELSLHTKKATYVLESCFSGTGTRNNPPAGTSIMRTDPDVRKRMPFKRMHPQSKLAPDPNTYVEIAASHSSLESFSEVASMTAPEKPYSLMTKAFVQTLNTAKIAGVVPSYRELIQDMRRFVAALPFSTGQTPQLEGNRDAAVFGLSEVRKKASIEIAGIDASTGRVKLRAGAIHGVFTGAQITFYARGSDANGEKGILGSGRVEAAKSFESEVMVQDVNGNRPAIPLDAVAAVTSSRFGAAPYFVDIPNAGRAVELSEQERIGEAVRQTLQKENLFDSGILSLGRPAANASNGEAGRVFRIGRGKPRDLFRTSSGKIEISLIAPNAPDLRCDGETLIQLASKDRLPAEQDDVYFVYEGDRADAPLFGTTVRADDPQIANKLANIIRGRSLHTSISSIDFKNSSLRRFADLKLETIPQTAMNPVCRDSQIRYQTLPQGTKFMDITQSGVVKPGTFVRVRIKNISGDVNRKELKDEFAAGLPLYFSVIALTNKGEVLNVYGSTGADEVLDDGREIIRTIRVDQPATSIRLVMFVTRQFVDFSFLELRGAARNSRSLLETIMTRPGVRSNDGAAAFSSPSDWGVIHYELMIKE